MAAWSRYQQALEGYRVRTGEWLQLVKATVLSKDQTAAWSASLLASRQFKTLEAACLQSKPPPSLGVVRPLLSSANNCP